MQRTVLACKHPRCACKAVSIKHIKHSRGGGSSNYTVHTQDVYAGASSCECGMKGWGRRNGNTHTGVCARTVRTPQRFPLQLVFSPPEEVKSSSSSANLPISLASRPCCRSLRLRPPPSPPARPLGTDHVLSHLGMSRLTSQCVLKDAAKPN